MTERLRVIMALSETGITTPVRSIPTTAAGGTPPVKGRGAYRCCTRNLRKSPRLTGNPPGEARLLAVSAVRTGHGDTPHGRLVISHSVFIR